MHTSAIYTDTLASSVALPCVVPDPLRACGCCRYYYYYMGFEKASCTHTGRICTACSLKTRYCRMEVGTLSTHFFSFLIHLGEVSHPRWCSIDVDETTSWLHVKHTMSLWTTDAVVNHTLRRLGFSIFEQLYVLYTTERRKKLTAQSSPEASRT